MHQEARGSSATGANSHRCIWAHRPSLAPGAAGANQYSPIPGNPALSQALSRYYSRAHGSSLDPDKNILVTSSGTEAIYLAFQGVLSPGDKCIVFEPYFPWYLPCVRLSGATPVVLTLEAPRFQVPLDALKAELDKGGVKMVGSWTPVLV